MKRYEYVGNAGSGAYGKVWICRVRPLPQGVVATDGLQDGMLVACKVFQRAHLDKEVMRLALREVRVLQFISHPNCVRLLNAFRSRNNLVCLIFEYVEGCAYKELCIHRLGLPPSALKLLAFQLCLALRYLHGEKLVHRDIKPSNILIDRNGCVKLCDFGFARFTSCVDPRDAERMSSYICTRWYRAPEVILSMDYGAPSDIWSLGCTIAELAVGQPLMPGNSSVDQLWRIMRLFGPLPPHMAAHLSSNARLSYIQVPSRGRPLPVRFQGASPRLLQFLDACLQLNPLNRPTADELLRLPYFFEVPSMVAGTPLERLVAAELAPRGGGPYCDNTGTCTPQRSPGPVKAVKGPSGSRRSLDTVTAPTKPKHDAPVCHVTGDLVASVMTPGALAAELSGASAAAEQIARRRDDDVKGATCAASGEDAIAPFTVFQVEVAAPTEAQPAAQPPAQAAAPVDAFSMGGAVEERKEHVAAGPVDASGFAAATEEIQKEDPRPGQVRLSAAERALHVPISGPASSSSATTAASAGGMPEPTFAVTAKRDYSELLLDGEFVGKDDSGLRQHNFLWPKIINIQKDVGDGDNNGGGGGAGGGDNGAGPGVAPVTALQPDQEANAQQKTDSEVCATRGQLGRSAFSLSTGSGDAGVPELGKWPSLSPPVLLPSLQLQPQQQQVHAGAIPLAQATPAAAAPLRSQSFRTNTASTPLLQTPEVMSSCSQMSTSMMCLGEINTPVGAPLLSPGNSTIQPHRRPPILQHLPSSYFVSRCSLDSAALSPSGTPLSAGSPLIRALQVDSSCGNTQAHSLKSRVGSDRTGASCPVTSTGLIPTSPAVAFSRTMTGAGADVNNMTELQGQLTAQGSGSCSQPADAGSAGSGTLTPTNSFRGSKGATSDVTARSPRMGSYTTSMLRGPSGRPRSSRLSQSVVSGSSIGVPATGDDVGQAPQTVTGNLHMAGTEVEMATGCDAAEGGHRTGGLEYSGSGPLAGHQRGKVDPADADMMPGEGTTAAAQVENPERMVEGAPRYREPLTKEINATAEQLDRPPRIAVASTTRKDKGTESMVSADVERGQSHGTQGRPGVGVPGDIMRAKSGPADEGDASFASACNSRVGGESTAGGHISDSSSTSSRANGSLLQRAKHKLQRLLRLKPSQGKSSKA